MRVFVSVDLEGVAGAFEALSSKPWSKPFTFGGKVTCEIVSTRTVRFSSESYLDAFRIFNSILPLSAAYAQQE